MISGSGSYIGEVQSFIREFLVSRPDLLTKDFVESAFRPRGNSVSSVFDQYVWILEEMREESYYSALTKTRDFREAVQALNSVSAKNNPVTSEILDEFLAELELPR